MLRPESSRPTTAGPGLKRRASQPLRRTRPCIRAEPCKSVKPPAAADRWLETFREQPLDADAMGVAATVPNTTRAATRRRVKSKRRILPRRSISTLIGHCEHELDAPESRFRGQTDARFGTRRTNLSCEVVAQ